MSRMNQSDFQALVNELKFRFQLMFGLNYPTYERQFTKFFQTINSDKNAEKYLELTNFGYVPQIREDGSVHYTKAGEGLATTLVNVYYALGFELTRQLMDNNPIALAEMYMRELMDSMERTKEIVGANILNRATNADYTYADGKVLLATDHPLSGGAGTFSNRLTNFAQFSQTSSEDLSTKIRQEGRDSAGKKKAIKSELYIFPPALENEAKRVFGSEKEVSSANNAINPVYGSQWAIWDELTDDSRWFVKTNIKGAVFQDRNAPDVSTDVVFDKLDAMKTRIDSAFVFGIYDPRCVFGG